MHAFSVPPFCILPAAQQPQAEAVGPLPASCAGAHFENSAGAITIESDETCRLAQLLKFSSICVELEMKMDIP